MTKKEVRRIGDQIRNNDYKIESDDLLNKIEEYRVSHKDSLAEIYSSAYDISFSLDSESITTYRIKRFESIINKLERHDKMQLDRMWDIAGCRCIMKTNKQVRLIRDLLYNKLEIIKEYNYLDNPPSSGYKAIHLFAKSSFGLVIEIQLRNQESHNWATLVEISDLLFEDRIKEKRSKSNLPYFHQLLSIKEGLTNKQRQKIISILRKKKYIEHLNAVFIKNYLTIRQRWNDLETHNNDYFILETKIDQIPSINSYDSFNDAEQDYFNKFKDNNNSNMVLTHLPNASYKKISIAYANYLLTYHEFIEYSFIIMEKLLLTYIAENKLLRFVSLYKFYSASNTFHFKSVVTEISTFQKIVNMRKMNLQQREWVKEINEHLKKRNKKSARLNKDFRRNFSRSIIPNFVYRIFILKTDRYNTRLRKKIIEENK